MRNKSLFLFDIDGTIFQSDGAGRRAMVQSVFSETGIKIELSVIDVAGKTDAGIFQQIIQKLNRIENQAILMEKLMRTYLEILKQELSKRPGRILEGTSPFITNLKERGDCVGILTGNVFEGAKIKLGSFHDHFEFGAYGDVETNRNNLFSIAHAHYIEKYEDHPKKIWIIGDTPGDIACARAAGVSVIGVATGPFSKGDLAEADIVLNDLACWPDIRHVL